MPFLGEAPPTGEFLRWQPSYLVSPLDLTSKLPYEGLFFDPLSYQQAGQYLPFPPAGGCPEGMRPFTVKKSFMHPPGTAPEVWDTKGCFSTVASPVSPTWGEGGCPAGTIEYAPWTRAAWLDNLRKNFPTYTVHDWRACKTPAQLCAEAIPAPSMLKAYPVCKGFPGSTPGNPPVSWITGAAADCGRGFIDTPREATAPCPPGFEKANEYRDGSFFMCRETPATHAMRVASWRAGCSSAVIAAPPKPLEEVSSGADLPGDIREHFVPDEVAYPTVVDIAGLKTSPLVIVAVGAALAYLLFGGRS